MGRTNSVIKRLGHRVCLSKIEQFASNCELVKHSSCLFDENYGLLLFVVLKNINSHEDYLNVLRSLFKSRFHPASVPDIILPIDNIPLNNHGMCFESFSILILNSDCWSNTILKYNYMYVF